jgi:hypothetical protein
LVIKYFYFMERSLSQAFLYAVFLPGLAGGGITGYQLLNAKVRQFEKAEWNVSVTASFHNPYDQQEISLDMVMVSPSGQPVVLPCYYEQGDSSGSLWKARFAPQEIGGYTYFFRLTQKGKERTSTPGVFAAEAGVKPGFLHKNDYYTFKFDNGELFRGIGENVAWESRAFENDKWTYDYLLPTLSRNGANFFRTWSCPWNLPLEWKKPGNSRRYSATDQYFNPSGIRRMDELLQLVDSLGLYFMLTLDMNSGNWSNNPYNQLNGGPVSSWADFFVSTRAMEKYKNKLRYVVARWGYSTNIAAWEFFNEIDNGVFNRSDSVLIPHSAVTQWHDEMSRYLKDIDPYRHLVTTSVSHRDIQGLNSIAYIDFNQKHIYKHTEKIPAIYPEYIQTFGKPYVVGEFGYRWEDADPRYAKEADFDYKRGLWYGLFSPTPILPMSWWWELFDDRQMAPYFRGVRTISDRMLSAGKGHFEPFVIVAGKLHAQGLRCGDEYFVYLLNETDSELQAAVSFPAAAGAPNEDRETGTIRARGLSGQRFDPESRQYSPMRGLSVADRQVRIDKIVLEAKKGLILVITENKN